MEIKIKYKNDLTIFTITGNLEFKKFIEVYRDFYKGNPTKFIIFDISAGSLNEISSKQVDTIAEFLKDNFHKRPAGAKSAFVVSGMANYGMVRMFEIWNDIKEIELDSKIFNKFDDALKWVEK